MVYFGSDVILNAWSLPHYRTISTLHFDSCHHLIWVQCYYRYAKRYAMPPMICPYLRLIVHPMVDLIQSSKVNYQHSSMRLFWGLFLASNVRNRYSRAVRHSVNQLVERMRWPIRKPDRSYHFQQYEYCVLAMILYPVVPVLWHRSAIDSKLFGLVRTSYRYRRRCRRPYPISNVILVVIVTMGYHT